MNSIMTETFKVFGGVVSVFCFQTQSPCLVQENQERFVPEHPPPRTGVIWPTSEQMLLFNLFSLSDVKLLAT